MSDTSNFGFGKFVPGFDFLQGLAKGASGGIPQLPKLSNWVAPTISVEELEKRIDELKAVQFWLEQNSRALTATIQALEVQKMTLATLKGMNVSMGDVAKAFQFKAGDSVMDGAHKSADAMGGAAEAMASAAARMTGRHTAADNAARESAQDARAEAAGKPATESTNEHTKQSANPKASDAAEPGMVDPMQWWGALTSQFQQIASTAMKDAATQTAIDTTKNMATGLAQEALKTATDMASQFATKGMKTAQSRASATSKTRTASAPATTAAKKTAAKKAAPRPAAKAAPKAAPRKTPARKPASRKSAG